QKRSGLEPPRFFSRQTRKSISRASRFANVYVDLARSFFWSGNDCRQQRSCRWRPGGLLAAYCRHRAGLEFDAWENAIVRALTRWNLDRGYAASAGVVW